MHLWYAGQHLSTLVSCCIYAVARCLNISVSFKRITQAMLRAFPNHDPQVFQTVELCSGIPSAAAAILPVKAEPTAHFGEIRLFYNNIFLPCMQHVLVNKSPASSKADAGITRLPLRSLSAQDMNSRKDKHSSSRLENMQ